MWDCCLDGSFVYNKHQCVCLEEILRYRLLVCIHSAFQCRKRSGLVWPVALLSSPPSHIRSLTAAISCMAEVLLRLKVRCHPTLYMVQQDDAKLLQSVVLIYDELYMNVRYSSLTTAVWHSLISVVNVFIHDFLLSKNSCHPRLSDLYYPGVYLLFLFHSCLVRGPILRAQGLFAHC